MIELRLIPDILSVLDHELVHVALRVLKCAANHEPSFPEDIAMLRSRVVALDPNTRADDLACQVIQDELAKSRKPKVLTATA